MTTLLFLSGAALVIWTVLSAIVVFFVEHQDHENPADDAKIALVGYAWIIGVTLVLSFFVLLGKAGGVLFVALLVAALVAFIVKLIKIARS